MMTGGHDITEKESRQDPVLTREPEREDTVPSYESVEEQTFTGDGAWRTCAEKVWKHEQTTIAGWNGQIDTLLVFAGLFSAVLTAFNVQYYAALQSTQVMLQLPADIAAPVLLSTLATTSNSPVAISAIVINTLWFLALVLSLAAASVGISVKQWLVAYIPPESTTARQRARIWHLRHRGLRKWRVPAIVAMLPILLQLSLLSFLAGVVVLLWTLNMIVAIVVMVPVAVLILLSGLVAIIPTFAPDCPYKSPQAWWIYLLIHRLTRFDGTLKRRLFETRRHFLLRLWRTVVTTRDWLDRENGLLRSEAREQTSESVLDTVAVLVAADQLVRDDEFLQDVIVPAFQLVDSSRRDFDESLRAFYQLVQSRAHVALPSAHSTGDSLALPIMSWFKDEMDSGSVAAMADLTLDMLIKVAGELRPNRAKQAREVSQMLAILQALLAALPRSQSRALVRLIDWYCDEATTYRPSHAGEDDPVEAISQHAVRYRSKIKAMPVRQQAALGSKAMDRLEQLLHDSASGSFQHRQAERGLLRLIGVVLDNRQSPVTEESALVVSRLCHLLGGDKPIPPGTRTTLIWLAARVAADLPLEAKSVIDLVACLRMLSQEPHNDIRSQNTLCLCTAIETSLDNIGSDDGLADVSDPLRSALHEFLDSISYLDRYGMFDYLRGILSVYGAMARRQARFLTVSDLAKLDACVAACTEGWPRGLAEAKILQERLAHLHGVLDTIPNTEGITQDDAHISICITAV
ncbi:uncharacterized protein B0H18DRAFT_940233 [Fomitopsis serialis]|uniref:uncharacterized protein n=1 Tax=Fomitopsis serialis TaxID=139415 RepID=UPI0020085C8B|nr:uncharacterized protein B0H18DRAFT_940233 [Neoantrodia serialis]KAH9915012.1 hypothetical protein B0H18DRAFT_940233 [Neoantrodia serialis]